MNSQRVLIRIALRTGWIGGLLGVVLFAVLFYLGRHPFLIPIIFDFRLVLLSIFIYYTLREFRDRHQQGILFLWQGIIGSFVFTLVYCATAALLLCLWLLLDPRFVSEYIRLQMEVLQGLPPELVEQLGKDTVDRNLERLPATNTLDLVLVYVRQTLLMSFFLSLVLSVVLRRQPKN